MKGQLSTPIRPGVPQRMVFSADAGYASTTRGHS
jgi:hypothetical protein